MYKQFPPFIDIIVYKNLPTICKEMHPEKPPWLSLSRPLAMGTNNYVIENDTEILVKMNNALVKQLN